MAYIMFKIQVEIEQEDKDLIYHLMCKSIIYMAKKLRLSKVGLMNIKISKRMVNQVKRLLKLQTLIFNDKYELIEYYPDLKDLFPEE